MRDNITRGNMDDAMAKKWFPFIGTLFLFIWYSNLIGYIPLPTNTEHPFHVVGVEIPSFAIYAATANISIPLVARADRLRRLQRRGHPRQGRPRLPQEPDPRRRHRLRGGPDLRARVPLELHAAALALRTSLRQHPRRPPDHPVHVRRAGGAAGPRGPRRVHAAVRRSPSTSSRSGWSPRFRRSSSPRSLPSTSAAPSPSPTKPKEPVSARSAAPPLTVFAQADAGSDAGKAIALGVGGGLGAVGAGVGIGIIFGKVIESVTRQPEMRDEITSIQWLGFALTEACFFYGLVAGLIAFFL